MPKKRLTMRQIRELMRLKYGGDPLSDRAIAVQLGLARSTVQGYLARIEEAGLGWPLPEDLSDAVLDQRLFGRPGTTAGRRLRAEPDWAALTRELKRPGVTLFILWEEYRAEHRRDLMEIVEDRYDRGSLLITSQVPVGRWHEIIGDPTLADAILDRIVHNAYRIELDGESLRKTPPEPEQA